MKGRNLSLEHYNTESETYFRLNIFKNHLLLAWNTHVYNNAIHILSLSQPDFPSACHQSAFMLEEQGPEDSEEKPSKYGDSIIE